MGATVGEQTCQLTTVAEGNTHKFPGITYGYTNPSNSNGTIVFFSYAGGTSPSDTSYNEATYAAYYDSKGFQVVQTMWDNGSGTDSNSDWEDTGFSGAGAKNVGYAAGRPAAFLNFVRFGSPTGGPPLWTAKGMCAQGNSAGGGAIAYILAWYGGYSYIDHAVFLSSPPISDFNKAASLLPNNRFLSQFVLPASSDAVGPRPGRLGPSTPTLALASDSGPTIPRRAAPECAGAARHRRRRPTQNGRT